MKTQLYTYDGTPLFEVALDETSSQDWSLMSDNKLSVSFELEECVVLTAGCFINFDGTRFYLLNEYKPTMIYSSAWKYDLTLGDAASWLSITLALKTIDGEDAPIFKYTGSAAEHAAIIVANLNRRMGTDQWKVGSIISTENIAIDYSGKYCSDVLQEIVDAKNTEWWIDGMTLNIGRAEFGESITLGYMNGVLGDIVCDMAGDMRSYAYLFPIGSTRNIDPTKYGHDRLQLPSGLKSVPINPEQGVAELVEEAAFAHIYPRYEGTVSAVRYVKATNEDGTPFLIYYIKDTAIPFNPNEYEIAGLVKHITFNSGELMGQEFEVNYSADSNEFELITRWTGDIQLPGGVLVPAVGDKYVVWNITMPDVYYTIASHELLDAARAFATDAIKDVSVYKVKLDYIDVQERGLKLRPGQRVRLLSEEYFASGYYDSRITRITRNIAYPDELSVDISAVRVVGTLSRLQASIQKTENIVSQFSGQLPAVIKSNDESPADDDSVYTSAKSQKEFLNKRKGGKVDAPVTFADVAEFINGIVAHKYIRVGNGYLRYNDELESWEMTGNLLVSKGFAWFANIDGFKPATVMDAVRVDNTTIVKKKDANGDWYLQAIGGGSGGSGGGLSLSDVEDYLRDYEYTRKSDVESLISNALGPYALTNAIPTNNSQLINDAGYITSSALNGYATEQWVNEHGYLTQHQSLSHLISKTDAANTYLSLRGGTLSNPNAAIPLTIKGTSGQSGVVFGENKAQVGWGYSKFGYSTFLYNYASASDLGISDNGTPFFNDHTLIHSGNIGEYNAGSANRLRYIDFYGSSSSLDTLLAGGGIVHNYNHISLWDGKNAPSGMSYGCVAQLNPHHYSDELSAQLAWDISHGGEDSTRFLWWRANDSRNFANAKWHQIAFTDSNVVSATKLQTARTIWGQPFDGSKNIGGVLSGFLQLTADINASYGIYRGDFFNANLTTNDLVVYNPFIGLFGNVAIGGPTANAKLHVHGDVMTKNAIHCFGDYGGFSLYSGVRNGEALAIERLSSNGAWVGQGVTLFNDGNVVVGGSSADAKLHVVGTGLFTDNVTLPSISSPSGVVVVNSSLWVNGNVSWLSQSQRSLKNIVDEQGLSLVQLERIKPIKFYWNDGRDSILHVGGVADVFAEVLPEVVSHWKDTLCLNYVDAAFYTAASLIAPVVDHERRIAQLERENEELKQKLNQLAA